MGLREQRRGTGSALSLMTRTRKCEFSQGPSGPTGGRLPRVIVTGMPGKRTVSRADAAPRESQNRIVLGRICFAASEEKLTMAMT